MKPRASLSGPARAAGGQADKAARHADLRGGPAQVGGNLDRPDAWASVGKGPSATWPPRMMTATAMDRHEESHCCLASRPIPLRPRHLPRMAGYDLEPPVKNGPGELAHHAQLKIHANVAVKASGGPARTRHCELRLAGCRRETSV